MTRRFVTAVTGGIAAWVLALGALASLDGGAIAMAAAGVSAPLIEAQAVQTDTLNSLFVVVQEDGHRAVVREVTFTTPISGLAALRLAGLDVTTAETDFGPAVCAIEGVGCPSDDCFCDPDRFWNYSYWDGVVWQSYGVGASSSEIAASGAVEGWRWGTFEGVQAPADQAVAAANALAWLRDQQEPATGGYGSGAGTAVEVAMALGANGQSLEDSQSQPDGRSLADFLLAKSTRYSYNGVAAAGKLAVATTATGGCRSLFSLTPSAYFSSTLGAYAPSSGPNAWAILGAAALGETVTDSAVASLAAQRQTDGGWEWQPGFGSDTNTTALAIQALIAAGKPSTDTAVVDGIAFLASAQQADGGFVYDPANPEAGSDANSTAYVVQALVAIGEDVNGGTWTTDEDATPISFLLALQQADGALAWQAGGDANLLATAQAVPALLGRHYPFDIKPLESCVTLWFRAPSQDDCAQGFEEVDCSLNRVR